MPDTPEEQWAELRRENKQLRRLLREAEERHVVTLAKAPLDVERLARAMVDADLDDIPEPDDIFDSMPEARLMAERIAAKYAEEPHDA
jgi:hypothetical protein